MAYREERISGVIARLVRDKGFGFIKAEGSNDDLFFHRTAYRGQFEELTEGQQVSFVSGHGPKGARAEDVELE
jgi:cold shock CspA family protein